MQPLKTEINPKWCNEWCAAWFNGGKDKKPSRCKTDGIYCKYVGHKGEPERLKLWKKY